MLRSSSLTFILAVLCSMHSALAWQQGPLPDTIIKTPVIFYPEQVSTYIDKFNTSFGADGKTIYFTATHQKLSITGIAYQQFINGRFQAPQFVPFVSADIPVADVQISPDGKTMFYSTFKDYPGKPDGFNFNLWKSELSNGEWQSPTPLGAPIASKGNEFYPVLTTSGNLYFNSDRNGNSDLYYSQLVNGVYQEPIALPSNINTDGREADAFISADESILIFVRVDEPDGLGNSDLYISFHLGENQWSDPVNMGPEINSSGIDGSPYITPDNKYLIFTTSRMKEGIKQEAVKSFDAFEKSILSENNGSLNFYIVSLNLEKYRNQQ